jgi:hypothetical protein
VAIESAKLQMRVARETIEIQEEDNEHTPTNSKANTPVTVGRL